MTIAVTAPSGNVGRFVVRDLVTAGLRPRVLAHSAESLDAALPDRVDLRVVDLGQPEPLARALAGVDALYLVVPANHAPDPVAEYARIGTVVSEAVVRAGVKRVVFQTSIGAEKRTGVGEIDGLARVEEQLDATGASVTHLRCGYFFSNLLLMLAELRGGMVQVLLPTDQPIPWVAPVDIARVVSLCLLRHDSERREVRAVHGPADLSWDQVARIITEATGQPVKAERIGDDQMRAALTSFGLGPAQVEAIVGMSVGIRDGFEPEQRRDVTTTTPTGLAARAYATLRPALAGAEPALG